MNTGFLTITQDRMTNEAARAFVKFRFAVKRGEVTVVEVTRHGPAKNYEGLKAMGFMLDRNSYGEEMLWIYYCARLEQVPHNCSTNAYVRAN